MTPQKEKFKIAIKLSEQRERIQHELSHKKESIAGLARQYGVADYTMRELLDGVGIEWRIRLPKSNDSNDAQKQHLHTLTVVLHRLCSELKVPCGELMPFLNL